MNEVESPTDPHTGTRRIYGPEPVNAPDYAGDIARGTGWLSVYLSDAEGEGYCCEVVVYVATFDDDVSFGTDEMVTVGRATRDEPDAPWRADDCADITHELRGYLAHDSLAGAQAECDRLGQSDDSFAIYLRPRAVAA